MAKEDIINKINNELVDETTNKITGESIKNVLLAIVDGMGAGSGQMEYWDVTAIDATAMGELVEVFALMQLAKATIADGEIGILPASIAAIADYPVLAVGFDRNIRYVQNGEERQLGQLMEDSGILLEDFGAIPIDEETFYKIN